jgi:hypothetical protein
LCYTMTSASMLGARVPTDIRPDAAGDVHPGNGGMSVAPSMHDLPARLVPKRLRHLVPSAAGNDDLLVWRMGEGEFVQEAISEQLLLRLDPKRSNHGFVEPKASMKLEDYQGALAGTHDEWSIDEE